MEQNKSSEADPHKHSQLMFDRGAKAIWWSKDGFSTMMLEKLGSHTHTNLESRHRPYTLYKNELKMDNRPKCKMQNYKTPGR